MLRISLRSLVLTSSGIAASAAAAGAVVLYTGLHNVAATHQHLRPTYRLLQIGLRESIKHHARHIEAPPLDDLRYARRGLSLYREHCIQCHGAPGVAPEPSSAAPYPATPA